MSQLLDDVLSKGRNTTPLAEEKQIRAFAWARVSTDMQEEKGLSLPEQLREIRAYAEKNGIEIVAEFSEAASAFQKKALRVEFQRMLEKARLDNEVSAIIVHDLSRFGRDSLEAQINRRDLSNAGVKVISISDPNVDPESVAGVYMEHILLAKNEAYSREIAFHTKKGCRANIQTRDAETGWCYKNGGQPLWGYKSLRLERGEIKKGRPLIKSIWVLDDRIVAGKPVHEWARHCLIELAAKGVTLDNLRDFCNSNGIPAPRQQYWGSTTWNSLLHPNSLLQYAGYGVWNVRGKKQRWNPPSEWVTVPNAQPALITEEEARLIMENRGGIRKKFFQTSNRAMSFRYLLSGGLFACGRCGGNMVGFERTKEGRYYVCNSVPNRRGLGCGQGVYVRQGDIEREVFAGLSDLFDKCTDGNGFVRKMNLELKEIWEESNGCDPDAPQKLREVEGKVANIRKAIEEGLADTAWANGRLRDLLSEQKELILASQTAGPPPQVSLEVAMAYRDDFKRLMASGENAETKRFLMEWVSKIQLAPEALEADIRYKIPEPVVDSMGAGVGFEPTTFGL